MSGKIRLAIAMGLVAMLLVAACSVDKRVRRKTETLSEDLMNTSLEFNRLIAWRYFDDASAMVLPAARADFLVSAESVYARVHMEGYKIALVQISPDPFPKIRGAVKVPPKPERPAVEIPPTPEEIKAREAKEKAAAEEQKFKEMPKHWYGLVLVRYINLTVVPSNQVSSPLIRQYWYWDENSETWLVDPEIDQLIDVRPSGDRAPADESIPLAPQIPAP